MAQLRLGSRQLYLCIDLSPVLQGGQHARKGLLCRACCRFLCGILIQNSRGTEKWPAAAGAVKRAQNKASPLKESDPPLDRASSVSPQRHAHTHPWPVGRGAVVPVGVRVAGGAESPAEPRAALPPAPKRQPRKMGSPKRSGGCGACAAAPASAPACAAARGPAGRGR